MTLRKCGKFIMKPMKYGQVEQVVYVKMYVASKGKAAQDQESVFASGRTLVVLNLPRQVAIEALFEQFGSIQHFDTTRVMGNGPAAPYTVRIVFKDTASAEKALEAPEYCAPEEIKYGIEVYEEEYTNGRPTLEELRQESDEFMRKFDQDEAQEQQVRTELAETVDEDGFQTVISTSTKRAGVETVSLQERKKQKKKELDNFYRFQLREQKRSQLKSLREQFEHDKKRIAELKKARAFHPEL